jgi:hypothetical protein
MTLFDLFSKPKVERARGHHEQGLEVLPERSQTPAHFYRRPEKELPTQPVTQSRPASRMNGPQPGAQTRPSSRLNGPIEKNYSKPLPSKPSSTPDDWDPPPLFQAYPQSVKHGSVQSTNLSTEVLLRAQHHRMNGISNAFGSTTSLPFVREGGEVDLNPAQESLYGATKRFSTAVSQAPELVEKVFVLVTAGRLVQYAGDGNYDRMPEKVLQLGERSAAFACDLIPGKHWVVQVVQAANEDGVATINKSRSLLSRLRMPTSAIRRTTTSFLLVFNSAEDMDGWLRAIRKVIDQFSGKTRGPARHSRQNTAEKIVEEPANHRAQRVQRPASMIQSVRTRSSSVHSHLQSPVESTTSQLFPLVSNISSHASPADSPRIPSVEEEGPASNSERVLSTEAPSLTATTTSTSTDQLRLEQLREGSRHSLVSVRTSRTSETETGTVATSQGSSTPPSPSKERFPDSEVAFLRSSYIGATPSYSARRLSSQPTLLMQPTPPVERITRIQSHTFSPMEKTDLFWLTKPSPVPPTILEIPFTRPVDNGPIAPSKTRTLRALSSDPHFHPDLSTSEDEKGIRRVSTLGQLPLNLSSRSLNRIDQPRTKPFFRPLPVRPSEPTGAPAIQNRTSQSFVTRRFSSLPLTAPSAPPSAAPPAVQEPTRTNPRFSVVPNVLPHEDVPAQLPLRPSSRLSLIPSVSTASNSSLQQLLTTTTARPRAPSYSLIPSVQPTPQQPMTPQKLLKRPTSMQIRSDPAPFLSSRRPSASNRSSSASPAPAPPSAGYRYSNTPVATPMATGSWRSFSSGGGVSAPPSIPMTNSTRSASASSASFHARLTERDVLMSMPSVMMAGLPPPVPPPSCPLPKTPAGQSVAV